MMGSMAADVLKAIKQPSGGMNQPEKKQKEYKSYDEVEEAVEMRHLARRVASRCTSRCTFVLSQLPAVPLLTPRCLQLSVCGAICS